MLAKHCKRIPSVGRYSLDVLTGNIAAGRMVFLAVERFLNDLQRSEAKDPAFPYYFDQGGAVSIIKYFRDLCPFKLVPFEQFIVANLFGWKKAGPECDIHPNGHRRFQTAYIEIGKGNGKTPLSAGIATYLTCADGEPNAEVYIAAPSKEQAAICFRDAVAIVDGDDDHTELRKIFKQFGCSHKMLSGNLSAGTSFLRPVSAEHKTLDGPRPHGVVADELHEHPNTVVLDKLTAGFKARHQPLSLEITNSGWDRETICFYHHDYSRQVLEKLLTNDAWFAYVCQLDVCDDCRASGKEQPSCDQCDSWLDPDAWIKANPGLGTILQVEYLEKQVKEALEIPATRSLKQRLNFCIWTQSETRAISAEQWKQCAGEGSGDPQAWRAAKLEALKGKVCYGAMDLASTTDIAGSAYFFPKQDGVPKTVLIPFFYIPKAAAQQHVMKNRVPIDLWVEQGFIFETPGNVLDYDFIRADVKRMGESFQIEEIAFDPWNAQDLTTHLQNDGFKMVKHPQTLEKLSEPTKHFLKMIGGAEFEHGNNPVLTWMADNLVTKSDASGNLRPIKPDNPNSPKKIDGIVAAIMADSRMTANPEPDPEASRPFFV